jgi:aspartokinase-like uncharacterized kinase
MTDSPIVVKVGGSLFDLPGLGGRLAAWLGTLQREVILIPGGGAAADFIQRLDRIHQLGEETCHWLALRSLSLTALLLCRILPGSAVVKCLSRCRPVWETGKVPILDLFAFATDDEGSSRALPHCWDVTSDSLAARVAAVAAASQLVLLKSVTIPPDMHWTEASRRGYVDAYFATAVGQGLSVRAVNLREWRP